MQRWLSWSKAHDWKSCVRLITDRGFESLSLRHKNAPRESSRGFCYLLNLNVSSLYTSKVKNGKCS